MSQKLGWREAVIEVLHSSLEPLHYTRIAEEIEVRQLRDNVGSTPASTVSAVLSDSLKKDGASSIFERIAPGIYRMRGIQISRDLPHNVEVALKEQAAEKEAQLAVAEKIAEKAAGFINALGMYWERDKVVWNTTPKLLGKQTPGSEPVDFTDQRGVYLLYDRNAVIYVGRALDRGVGTRLREHTQDRLNGRWDRFSWFGIYEVSASGRLEAPEKPFTTDTLIATMEALLIESVEPVQNRRRGDDFNEREFLQAIDPEIEKANVLQMMQMFQRKLLS